MKQHDASCGCTARLSRRGLLGLGLVNAVTMAFPALASGGHYEAMLVNCIDPRFTTGSSAYMAGRGLKGLFSHFLIAGRPLRNVSPRLPHWPKTLLHPLPITLHPPHLQPALCPTS